MTHMLQLGYIWVLLTLYRLFVFRSQCVSIIPCSNLLLTVRSNCCSERKNVICSLMYTCVH